MMIEIEVCDQSQRGGCEQDLTAINTSPRQKQSAKIALGHQHLSSYFVADYASCLYFVKK
jgi:hypothetical protein